MQHPHRWCQAVFVSTPSAKHAERVYAAYIVPKKGHRLQSVLFYQSADTLSFVRNYQWKQLEGELSTTVAQAMRLV